MFYSENLRYNVTYIKFILKTDLSQQSSRFSGIFFNNVVQQCVKIWEIAFFLADILKKKHNRDKNYILLCEYLILCVPRKNILVRKLNIKFMIMYRMKIT